MPRDLPSAPPDEPWLPPHVSPARKPMSFLRTVRTFIRNPLETIPEAAYHEPILLVDGLRKIVWVADPELVKAVLLDRREEFPKDPLARRVLGPLVGNGVLIAEGKEWKWQRQTVAPLFRHAELLDYVPAMNAGAEWMLDSWRAAGPGSTHLIDQDMGRATYHVISNTILAGGGEQVGAILAEDGPRYGRGLQWSLAYAAMGAPEWLPRPLRPAMRRQEARLRGAVGELIRARRADPTPRDDLFDRLLAAAEPETGRRMSDEQLVDNLLTFLIAGHDTTAKALAWTLYLLSHAPEWEARMLEEIRQVVGEGPVEAAHLERLTVTQQVLKEGMRLLPSVPVITRYAAADLELGGLRLAKGTSVGISIYAIHRHSRLWDEPHRFDPARFAPEREAGMSRYQFMPFGGGPRVCIGAAFAMIEATTILATLVRAARFDCPPGPPPVPLSRIVLTPKGGLPLRVTLRAA
jgi:cytochrome P450